MGLRDQRIRLEEEAVDFQDGPTGETGIALERGIPVGGMLGKASSDCPSRWR